MTDVRTIGVEEEFLLVDPRSGQPTAVAESVLAREPALTGELQREQVETTTEPCTTLDELGEQLRTTRATAARAAERTGVTAVPLATSPPAVEPTTARTPRYAEMARRFGLTVAEELTCGCHVHVAVGSDEEAVAALDRIRPWLAPLLALSANSPFWDGTDSGYASYRSRVWSRWPSAGPPDVFGSAAAYREYVDAVLATGTLLDEGMVYLDARPSRQHPTLEIRVADVCREADDAVLVAALARGLVETAVRAWRAGEPPAPVRAEVLRLAAWRAGRDGMGGELVDPRTWRPAPASDVLDALVGHVREALDDAGDTATVQTLLADLRSRGTGAAVQRATYERTGTLGAVAREAALSPLRA